MFVSLLFCFIYLILLQKKIVFILLLQSYYINLCQYLFIETNRYFIKIIQNIPLNNLTSKFTNAEIGRKKTESVKENKQDNKHSYGLRNKGIININFVQIENKEEIRVGSESFCT
ncbi:hypothetical protein RFI_11540 [Reticulomyxa filosa]|uniref:Uncharacterized protein n=1 Tax=Reticulomyxa filosa TaxID=46433 RepID=X6NHV7_RETFI|nr:hypothetical protein RFI_11540 [Reticulomyxa filosa]|eukprot:ETO25596.1 hypothetical protein RFI_11540 [Reticulomyxa filosa]